ncbi:MAG: cupin domain-containing protein [Candidatus Bathyarchaeota archaeon]|nr:MAG: cupin domain-containing protein [Candidatus Bathyarchaeota archaeon]
MMLGQILGHLIEDVELYADLLSAEGVVRVAVALTDTGEGATIVVGDEIGVLEGSVDPDIRLTMESGALREMLDGKADFGALISRSRMSDVRPINFQLMNPEKASAAIEALKTMGLLFPPGRIKVKELRRELAGDAHGAHPMPLVYWDGIRFAWYVIDAGEVLNEEGERDPYPQAMVILKGKGVISLDEVEMELRPGTVVYIPVNSVHRISAEEDVELLWLAWKTPP